MIFSIADEATAIYNSDLPKNELQKKYGISRVTINNIKAGKRWGHLNLQQQYLSSLLGSKPDSSIINPKE